MPPEGQPCDGPAEGHALQASGVEEPTFIVESCLTVFFESQLGQATLAVLEALNKSLSKACPQSLQMYS